MFAQRSFGTRSEGVDSGTVGDGSGGGFGKAWRVPKLVAFAASLAISTRGPEAGEADVVPVAHSGALGMMRGTCASVEREERWAFQRPSGGRK